MTSQNEEEYFARLEVEKKKKWATNVKDKMQEEELKELKETHWMHCPKCGLDLQTLLFKGVEIERCYHCGVSVLDQGELEKLTGSESSLISEIVGLFR